VLFGDPEHVVQIDEKDLKGAGIITDSKSIEVA
jgi:hypothetical protein